MDGGHYEGHFYKDSMSGYGRCSFSNSDVFVGKLVQMRKITVSL